jgi:hypothetical protein
MNIPPSQIPISVNNNLDIFQFPNHPLINIPSVNDSVQLIPNIKDKIVNNSIIPNNVERRMDKPVNMVIRNKEDISNIIIFII